MDEEIVGIDPTEVGWTRHPTEPRTWVTPGDNLYTFPDDQPEVVIIPKVSNKKASNKKASNKKASNKKASNENFDNN
jgi:hypothetical protein